jgi:hypothetical protein
LIEYEADVLYFEEDVIALEDLLQVTIAKLSDEIDVVEIVDALAFGHQDFDHADYIWMLAILQQDNFPQDASGLRQGLEEVDDLLDGYVRVVGFACGLCHVAV